jgi:hypothetical protein
MVGDEQVVAQHANTSDDGSLGEHDDKLGNKHGDQRTNHLPAFRQEYTIVLKLHTAMRIRGMAKVVCVAIVANQVLTMAFAYAVQQLDPGAPGLITTIFSFLTCGLVSIWLQSDARRAYLLAREKGCITPVDKTNPALKIAPDCPKLWLVVLHIEMNPAAVGL